MRIGRDALPGHLLAHFRPPCLGKGDEEPLVAGQTVDNRRGLALQRELVSLIGHRDAAQIADVFTQRQLAAQAGLALVQRAERIVLRGQLRGQRVERLAIGRRPPVAQRAGSIVLRALIVEPMADLVADDCADRAVIDRRIGLGVEKGRLENGSGEHDLVGRRHVIGVDRLRGHQPFALVDRLGQIAELVLYPPISGGDIVVESGTRLDRHVVVSLELVGITDLDPERVQLLLGLDPGRRGHPGKVLEIAGQRQPQVANQFLHRRLAGCREIALDIKLADRLAHLALNRAQPALPALALGLATGKRGAVKGEAGVIDLARQDRCLAVKELCDGPSLDHRDRLAVEQRKQRGHPATELGKLFRGQAELGDLGGGRRHFLTEQLIDLAQARGHQHAVEREAASHREEFGAGQAVGGQVRIARNGPVPSKFGQLALERIDAFCRSLGIGVSRLAEQERNVFLVLRPQRQIALAVDQIIIAVWQAQAAGPDVQRVAGRGQAVDGDIGLKRRGNSRLGKQFGQLDPAIGGSDPRQIGLGRGHPGGFDRGGIDERPIAVANLLLETARGMATCGHFLDDRAHRLFGPELKVERNPAGRILRLDNIGRRPFAVHVSEEIVTGLGRAI